MQFVTFRLHKVAQNWPFSLLSLFQVQLIWVLLLTHHFLVFQFQPFMQPSLIGYIVSQVYHTYNKVHFRCCVLTPETIDLLGDLHPLLQE